MTSHRILNGLEFAGVRNSYFTPKCENKNVINKIFAAIVYDWPKIENMGCIRRRVPMVSTESTRACSFRHCSETIIGEGKTPTSDH